MILEEFSNATESLQEDSTVGDIMASTEMLVDLSDIMAEREDKVSTNQSEVNQVVIYILKMIKR